MSCVYHGKQYLRKDGRCRVCRNRAVNKRRKRLKEILVIEAGGQCSLCGYNECIGALEFHHIDPSQKEFRISAKNIKSLDRLRKEAWKCMLICSNCHAELHECR